MSHVYHDCIKKTPAHKLPKSCFIPCDLAAFCFFKGLCFLFRGQQGYIYNLRLHSFDTCVTRRDVESTNWVCIFLNHTIIHFIGLFFCFCLCFSHIMPCHFMSLSCSHLWIFSMILYWMWHSDHLRWLTVYIIICCICNFCWCCHSRLHVTVAYVFILVCWAVEHGYPGSILGVL